MKIRKLLFTKLLLFFFSFLLPLSSIEAEVFKTNHAEVELLADTEEIRAGDLFNIALRINPEKGWHLYWKYPGDSGLSPKFEWDIPTSFKKFPLEWPSPERMKFGPLVNYVYSGEVFIVQPLGVAQELYDLKEILISLKAEWVLCNEKECIPNEAFLSLSLPIISKESTPRVSKWKSLIDENLREAPRTLGWLRAKATSKDEFIELEISSSGPSLPSGNLIFLPENSGIIDNASEQIIQREDKKIKIIISKSAEENLKGSFSGLLIAEMPGPQAMP